MILNVPTGLTVFYSLEVVASSALSIHAPATELKVGSSVRLTVKRRGQEGHISTEDITFVSTDARVASVDADGLVTARSTRGRKQTTVVIVAVLRKETGSIRLIIKVEDGTQE